MANASEQSLSQVGSVVFKNTVENLLLSIEEKAEKDPKTAEICEWDSNCEKDRNSLLIF